MVVPMVIVGETQPGGFQSIIVGVGEWPQDTLGGSPVSRSGGSGGGEGVVDWHEAMIEELSVDWGDASQEGALRAGLDHGSKATIRAVGMVLRVDSFHGESKVVV